MYQVYQKVKFLHKMISMQQPAEIRKGESVKAPATNCEYLTFDKIYAIKKVFVDGNFLIKDDTGKNIFCKATGCGHLNGMNWVLNN